MLTQSLLAGSILLFIDPVQAQNLTPGVTAPVSSSPTSFSGTLTTTAAQYLAAGTYKRIGFQVFGTGTACYSFTSASVSISGTACTNGYSITPSSGGFVSSPVAVPNTALYIVEASGSTLTVYGDWQ
jgi:hypothetical protein